MILVDIAAAVICFAGHCYPALVGVDTPRGQFELRHEATAMRGYGGDILTFHENAGYRWAIHRTWPGRERLYEEPLGARVVTKGCVNVQPWVYQKLVDCCSTDRVIIR